MNEHTIFYARVCKSLLGTVIVHIRLPHQKRIVDWSEVDKQIGTHYKKASYFTPSKSWGVIKCRIKWHEENFLCRFRKNRDGSLSLFSVDGEEKLYKVYGDVLRYCLHKEPDGYVLMLKDVDEVPHEEDSKFVTYNPRIKYRTLEEVRDEN